MHAGQALVQFAEGAEDHCDYAIKFFLDYSAFLTEAALYAACFPRLRAQVSDDVIARADATATLGVDGAAAVPLSQVAARFLPQVEAVCDGSAGGLEDPRGRWLPPCIVMEKGESLQEWSDRAEPDLFTALAVRSCMLVAHACTCLARGSHTVARGSGMHLDDVFQHSMVLWHAVDLPTR